MISSSEPLLSRLEVKLLALSCFSRTLAAIFALDSEYNFIVSKSLLQASCPIRLTPLLWLDGGYVDYMFLPQQQLKTLTTTKSKQQTRWPPHIQRGYAH
eukprot:m.52256 g.52256  ORF g.52256 m.52256 type:complete len:99 (+) comp10779_c0_seq1:1582-1878(+)